MRGLEVALNRLDPETSSEPALSVAEGMMCVEIKLKQRTVILSEYEESSQKVNSLLIGSRIIHPS